MEAQVLVVSKTKMDRRYCVGGVIINDNHNTFVRLLNSDGTNQKLSTPLTIGSLWNLSFRKKENCLAPHTEDIFVRSGKVIEKSVEVSGYVKTSLEPKIHRGSIDDCFESRIKWTSGGSGFINNKSVPLYSVEFCIFSHDLEFDGKYYVFNNRRVKYVGLETPINLISKGTLLRLSLARWWAPEGDYEEKRCYLQLSGWY